MSTMALIRLQQETQGGLDAFHSDVKAVRFVDFPDHTNIGDSAIALGSVAYWNSRHLPLLSVHNVYSTPRSLFKQQDAAIALQGGGSFGGLYPPMNDYRLRLVREITAAATLIQMPQSVVFPNDRLRKDNADAFALRPSARVAARDRFSQQELANIDIRATLVPDAAHALGPLLGPEATNPYVILARTDPEAATNAGGRAQADTFDWPRASVPGRAIHRVKYQRAWPQAAQRLADRRPEFWINRAQNRLDTGIPLLAAGRTVITDRLHAMILGLHLGRRVIAVDNANRKLTNYASTWLTDSGIPLEFSESFADAVKTATTSQL